MSETLAGRFAGTGEWLIVLVPLLLIAYSIPTFIALGRRHRFVPAIGLINGLLGWTLLGWLAAIIWAVNRDVREPGEETESMWRPNFVNEPGMNEPGMSESWFAQQGIEHAGAGSGPMKQCRYCAESIKAEALVCRHCGRESGSPPAQNPAATAVNVASMELNIEELQALLEDHEHSVQQRLVDIEPATNFVAPAQVVEVMSVDVAQQLSGWKKFG